MLNQWSMAKKTLDGGLVELQKVLFTKKQENNQVRYYQCCGTGSGSTDPEVIA
jgi:hypothetical protein